jgi:hypothetical protein
MGEGWSGVARTEKGKARRCFIASTTDGRMTFPSSSALAHHWTTSPAFAFAAGAEALACMTPRTYPLTTTCPIA